MAAGIGSEESRRLPSVARERRRNQTVAEDGLWPALRGARVAPAEATRNI